MKKVQDLKTGDYYRLPGKRKFRFVSKVIVCGVNSSKSLQGKVLICHSDCSQLVLPVDTDVILNVSEVHRMAFLVGYLIAGEMK